MGLDDDDMDVFDPEATFDGTTVNDNDEEQQMNEDAERERKEVSVVPGQRFARSDGSILVNRRRYI